MLYILTQTVWRTTAAENIPTGRLQWVLMPLQHLPHHLAGVSQVSENTV